MHFYGLAAAGQPALLWVQSYQMESDTTIPAACVLWGFPVAGLRCSPADSSLVFEPMPFV